MVDPSLLELSEAEYLQVEEALSQTARGRAFLRMRDRRTRTVATDEFNRIAAALERQVSRLCTADPSALVAVRGGPAGAEIERELASIIEHVQQTRSDIAALRPADSGANRIEAATGELDAIVGATERATTDILNAVERISEWNSRLPRTDPDIAEISDAIEAWVIEIMTACSFQDITGQRTTKVVNTLRYIEERVNTMIEIWGVDKAVQSASGFTTSHRKMNDTRPDAHLLNGPALGEAVDQDAIDALFSSIATEMPNVFDRAEPIAAEPPAPPPPPAAVKPPPPKPQPVAAASSPAEISQTDIDKLFA